MLDLEDTLCAPAAAIGVGLRSVIRLSGPQAVEIASQLLSRADDAFPDASSRAIEGEADLPLLGPVPLLLLVWPTTRSYTRQPSVELHFPASRIIQDALLARLQSLGARLARPGEFTLRAYLAGRIDLDQAEAVLAVIHADSDAELQSGLQRLAGGVFTPIHTLREDLLCLLADVEAALDFVEEDIEFVTRDEVQSRIAAHLQTLRDLRRRIADRSADAAAWRVALVGPPNAGKSSLLNSLAGRDASLVSPQAGTTRDVVEVRIDLAGRPILLLDPAGLDADAHGEIDRLAQQKAREAIDAAHLLLICRPADAPSPLEASSDPRCLDVITKCDLAAASSCGIPTSTATGAGLAELRQAIVDRFSVLAPSKAELLGAASRQSAASLDAAIASLENAADRLHSHGPDEAFAVDLRCALDALGEITGQVYTDDILDRVFSRFCIGK